ncbi:class I SAM-dependent methyltransferase, partial [Acinetobacter baumannii]
MYALDPTPEMLAIVEREATRRGLSNIEPVLGTAEDLPFASGSLDGVACRTAAHHFLDVGS